MFTLILLASAVALFLGGVLLGAYMVTTVPESMTAYGTNVAELQQTLDRRDRRIVEMMEQYQVDRRHTGELTTAIDELERDAHEYRMEISRLQDELTAVRKETPSEPAKTSTLDRFAWLEISDRQVNHVS